MKFLPAAIPGVIVIEPDVHRDLRGFFLETYHEEKYRAGGIADVFAQDNQSRSVGGTIRGLHIQTGSHPQAKLIRVLYGEIRDVAVDVRRGSPTFLQSVSLTLSADNFLQMYIPAGFAHGFAVLSDSADIEYKCSEIYHRPSEIGILWNDPDIGVSWPISDPIVSERDRSNPRLADIFDRLPVYSERSTTGHDDEDRAAVSPLRSDL